MTSTKPYLLRAIFEWAEDNGFTPQVLVNANFKDVSVPQAHVVDGQIVLNISSAAVRLDQMDNECLRFSARFSGVEEHIYLPVESVLAIFARENSQGIFFEESDDSEPDPVGPGPVKRQSKPTQLNPKTKPRKDASHLKIIK